MKKAFLFLCLFIFLFASNCSLNKDVALESRLNNQEKRIAELEKELERLKETCNSYFEAQAQEIEMLKEFISLLKGQQDKLFAKSMYPFIPEKVMFCDQEVPLERFDVRERLEWALRFEIDRWAMVLIFLRSGRWFPTIEEKIKELGLPDDLKYVAVVESDLDPKAYSFAGAVGMWQIIKSTGKNMMGLRINSYVDERCDPEKATEAALKHLKSLHQRLGEWPSALAGYNMNPDTYAGIKAKERAQDFYDVKPIPVETQRYPFLAIAVKLIMENPEQYGFPSLEQINELKYKPYDTELRIVVVNYQKEKIADIAARLGMNSYQFRVFNPHLAPTDRRGKIIKDYLPQGKYRIYIKKDP